MADTKITALTALTAADPANDVIPIVDVSDTSMAASGTTKKISVNNILGASGTATLASATITGALTVDSPTLVVNAAGYTDRVGIGIATPTQALHVRGNILTGSAAGTDSYVNVATDGVQNAYMGFNNSGSTNSSGASNNNQYIGNGNGYPIQIVTNGASIATFSTAAVTLTAQNLVMATSGKGIDFSATANSSGTMTSELLADYEEGTFTPTIVGNTIAGVGVYVNQVGTYTKIGNQVTIWVNIEWSAHTGTGTQMYIGGFPFSLRTSTGYNAYAALGYINNIALTAGNFPLILAGSSDSFARFFQSPTGGGAATAVPMDTAGQVGFTLSYQV
jgi:hypothetical protein